MTTQANDILTNAMEWIAKKAAPIQTIEHGELTYAKENLSVISPPLRRAIKLENLSSLVDYIHSEDTPEISKLIVHVCSPLEVDLIGLSDGKYESRHHYAKVEISAPSRGFFQRGHDQSMFIVGLQTQFVETDNRNELMRIAQHVTYESQNEFVDDGVQQSVVLKQHAQLQSVKLPNPVTLQPFRTFSEIEQPESPFVFRHDKDDRTFKLIEADNNAWMNTATARIKAWLSENIHGEIMILA